MSTLEVSKELTINFYPTFIPRIFLFNRIVPLITTSYCKYFNLSMIFFHILIKNNLITYSIFTIINGAIEEKVFSNLDFL